MNRKPNAQDLRIHRLVVSEGQSIQAVAEAYGVSNSTIRNRLDKVTDWNCEKFTITVSGEDMTEILGWLRNGNTTSGELADRIESSL